MGRSDIQLPDSEGRMQGYVLQGTPLGMPSGKTNFNRIALSAVHVVCDPLSASEPSSSASIDWDATLGFRRHILDLGLSVAEAMDTAQRGMGLDAAGAMELVSRTMSMVETNERDRIFSGVSTDNLDIGRNPTLDQIESAYLWQMEAVQKTGSRVIVMASPALARVARTVDDYIQIYSRVISSAQKPVIIHWLGAMFDKRLDGYWGGDAFDRNSDTVLSIINENIQRVDGIKLSLLDDASEIALRRRLPEGVRMYTGDDFNYPDLIAGDDTHHSDALLGIFDAIAPAASAALAALVQGDKTRYDELLAPTVPLSRLIFRPPTQFYKTGIVFLAWLNGFQSHFVMLGGAQAMRPLPYFVDVFRLADQAGLLRDPDLACERMRQLLQIYGVE